MRILACLALIGCTSTSSPPATDRTDCLSCHTVPAPTDPPSSSFCAQPDHSTFADPTACSSCHGTTAWCPADASHTKFNLTSGSHAGWDCASCHLAITYDPPAITDATAIDCTNCHWHDQARVDPYHVGKSGYVYGPATCLAAGCHGGRRQ